LNMEEKTEIRNVWRKYNEDVVNYTLGSSKNIKECNSCKYWRVTAMVRKDEDEASFYGLCRRYPPSIRRLSFVDSIKLKVYNLLKPEDESRLDDICQFPLTADYEFCGEWSKSAWVDRLKKEKSFDNILDPESEYAVEEWDREL